MTFRKFQILLVTLILSVSTFFGGLYLGKRGYDVEVKKNPPYVQIDHKFPDTNTSDLDFASFWQVWDMLTREHLERPLDQKKMLYGAIKGMVDSVGDPYSSFLDPEINKMVDDSLNGVYEGIGAELGVLENQIIVVTPIDGSPAKEVLMQQDKILEIDGLTTFGMNLNEAVSKIRGSAGTIIKLKIQRGSFEPFDVTIKRAKINISSVTWEDKGEGTVYIRISRFGSDTNPDWTKTAKEINTKMRELDAVIIDVRGNPGGYLLSPVHIAGDFYKGVVVYEQDAVKKEIPYSTEDRKIAIFSKIPTVIVLIDKGTASASEILAAALKENIDATLVGERSFGKGTIQDAKKFDDGSGLHITIAKWLTSQKVWVGEKDSDGKAKGLTPDIEVKITEEDLKNLKDPQLEKALELASKF